MEKLFVIAGKARSGKDTIAKIIKENTNIRVLIYSCTTYLKKYIKDIYGVYDESNKPRELLQSFGRKIKKEYPNFFLDRINEDIRFLSLYYDIIIITGVRLVRELEFLKNTFNGILIKVESDNENNLTEKEKQDITETDVDNYNDYDYILKNKTYEKIEEQIKKIMEERIWT